MQEKKYPSQQKKLITKLQSNACTVSTIRKTPYTAILKHGALPRVAMSKRGFRIAETQVSGQKTEFHLFAHSACSCAHGATTYHTESRKYNYNTVSREVLIIVTL